MQERKVSYVDLLLYVTLAFNSFTFTVEYVE